MDCSFLTIRTIYNEIGEKGCTIFEPSSCRTGDTIEGGTYCTVAMAVDPGLIQIFTNSFEFFRFFAESEISAKI